MYMCIYALCIFIQERVDVWMVILYAYYASDTRRERFDRGNVISFWDTLYTKIKAAKIKRGSLLGTLEYHGPALS